MGSRRFSRRRTSRRPPAMCWLTMPGCVLADVVHRDHVRVALRRPIARASRRTRARPASSRPSVLMSATATSRSSRASRARYTRFFAPSPSKPRTSYLPPPRTPGSRRAGAVLPAARSPSGRPQLSQKRADALSEAVQCGHDRDTAPPQVSQNIEPGRTSGPQAEQNIVPAGAVTKTPSRRLRHIGSSLRPHSCASTMPQIRDLAGPPRDTGDQTT
jgi:hypothetical protein